MNNLGIETSAATPYTIMMMGRVMVGSILTNQSPVTLAETTPLARLTAEYEIVVVPASSPYQTMADLVAAFQSLLADPESRCRMAAAGLAFARRHRGATDRTLALIGRFLPAPD
jgi:tripartite-type tricarboxylate transporter receptor subunit TctC